MKNKMLIGVVGCLLFSGCFGFHYSDGDRAGVVRKFSKKGFFNKTWEGELIMNVTADDKGVIVPDIFEFSIHRDNQNQDTIAKDILAALDSGKRVKLHYDQQLYFWDTHGSTDHFITKVEFLDRK